MRYFILLLIAVGLVACGGGRTADKPTKPVKLEPRVVKTIVGGNPKYADSDPVEWPGATPWQYPVHGVDVSRYQTDLDWRMLRRNSISFAFIKATEGGDHTDPAFRSHWWGAAQAGIPRGAYHFYYFCRKPVEQANWFIRHVPKDPNALPPVLDIEWNHASRSCRLKPEPAQVRAAMRKYLRRIAGHYGKTPVIYTTVDFYHDNALWKVNGYPMWLRSVADHPSKIYPGERWTFWQYTGTGRVAGAPDDIDLNVFSGSREAWAKWLSDQGITTTAQ